MEAIYALEEAGVSEVVDHLGDASAYDSVRVTLGILERKGFLRHRQEGNRNVYVPVVPVQEAQASAMQQLMQTFFGNSPGRAILAFLDHSREQLSEGEIEEIARWIDSTGADE